MSNLFDTTTVFNRGIFLAPMAGVNDPVFRAICKCMGANLTYSEMISAKGLEYGNLKSAEMLKCLPEETPIAVQLFGKEPQVMARQAAFIEQHCAKDVALIDINMGCSVRKIAGKGEGAALMLNPQLAGDIMRAVVNAVNLPVTVKFRRGYEIGNETALDFAKLAQDCNVAAIAVHGRYAMQLYGGTSDKDLIARIKQVVDMPVIASGDVFSANDISYYLDRCKADAVMIARGARGNPWIFKGEVAPTIEERASVALKHACGLERIAPHRLSSMRKHLAWYFKGTPHATAIRRAVNDCKNFDDYRALLNSVITQDLS